MSTEGDGRSKDEFKRDEDGNERSAWDDEAPNATINVLDGRIYEQLTKQTREAKEELKYIKTIIEGPHHANTRGNIVVAGGRDGKSRLNSVESFSWKKRTWEPLQSIM